MDFPSLEQLRQRQTRKWTVYPEDVLPLWIAESDFPTSPKVLECIKQRVAAESFGYSPASHDLEHALSGFCQRHFDWTPDPENIVLTPDVVRALMLAINHFTTPGSAVIVPTPAYPPFLALAPATGRRMIEISAEGGIDLAEVEQAFIQGAGSILLCNPHNPLGYQFSREFLRDLADLAERYGARIISDEIHAPLVYEEKHIPAASVSEVAARVVITALATSKAWNIAGLKCAQMIFSNPEDKKIWDQLPPPLTDGVSTLGIFAAAACYRDTSSHLDEQRACLRHNRDWLVRELPQRIPGLKVSNPQATYLMWLDFRETSLPEHARDHTAAWLIDHAKVALNEGLSFGTPGRAHARLNFATSPEILDEAVDRLAHALTP
ncbi:aminotransferase class I/II-fold pyridoxal phosphate-dependent enzyme [Corynebacterium poyangense]|uniref:cysteine-S-conjugate beta-lyase n=1 Tax=Corynebacterium poyangense TaxID=2684405 RepID=A0A7H0SQ30_9CORY|nr:MalY/PatB family protein [Corynebacterium poyangense]MBZ8178412.1 aminotransferase class I/II-fold pyridoxal phosphate-dependent enzyme [Corynebacterium poyangense]QNQ90655.1 aminotransferase class I/II-fold pyridoxal phosphate-dependent enzyme [Corynebacterium poyangense]